MHYTHKLTTILDGFIQKGDVAEKWKGSGQFEPHLKGLDQDFNLDKCLK